jgi:aspartyl-tRNA synthetase
MTDRESVKDVIAFPKSSKGEDMMVGSPSRMTDAELSRYHLQLKSVIGGEVVGQKGVPSAEEKVEDIKSEPPS